MHRVFVYGTLLRGLSNHHWLEGAHFVGEATTAESLRLVDLGEYPAVIDEPGAPVVGEVWEVDDDGLAQLDVLEDYPTLYTRRLTALRTGEPALIYVLAPGAPVATCEEIRDGDYRAHVRRFAVS